MMLFANFALHSRPFSCADRTRGRVLAKNYRFFIRNLRANIKTFS